MFPSYLLVSLEPCNVRKDFLEDQVGRYIWECESQRDILREPRMIPNMDLDKYFLNKLYQMGNLSQSNILVYIEDCKPRQVLNRGHKWPLEARKHYILYRNRMEMVHMA